MTVQDMNSQIIPGIGDVMAMVNEVWSSFVDSAPLVPASPTESERCWSATVTVTGAWPGMVSIEVSPVAASALTRHMLAMSQVGDEDVADAIGELVNMIGGNVKSLMPEPSVLSLPVVAQGRIAMPSGTVEVTRLGLLWHDEPITLRIHTFDNSRSNS